MRTTYTEINFTTRRGIEPTVKWQPEASHDVVIGQVYTVRQVNWSDMYVDKSVVNRITLKLQRSAERRKYEFKQAANSPDLV